MLWCVVAAGGQKCLGQTGSSFANRRFRNMNDKASNVLVIFAAALELPAGERAAFLVRECGDDHTLKARVEALLRADSEAGNFLEQPPPDAGLLSVANTIGEKPGDHIGRY